jgi:hypothetical protein
MIRAERPAGVRRIAVTSKRHSTDGHFKKNLRPSIFRASGKPVGRCRIPPICGAAENPYARVAPIRVGLPRLKVYFG